MAMGEQLLPSQVLPWPCQVYREVYTVQRVCACMTRPADPIDRRATRVRGPEDAPLTRPAPDRAALTTSLRAACLRLGEYSGLHIATR